MPTFDSEIGKGTGADDRAVTVPDDLRAALDRDTKAGRAFASLSYSHQREYVAWIEEAKRPETRARRVQGTIDRLT